MDEIQRKLALIDRQLAWSWANVHKQIISTTPLLFAAAGLTAGIIIQNILHLPISIWLIAIGIFMAATIISYLVKVRNLTFISAYMALIRFLCLGAIRLIHFHQPKQTDRRRLFFGKTVKARNSASTDSRIEVHTLPVKSYMRKEKRL